MRTYRCFWPQVKKPEHFGCGCPGAGRRALPPPQEFEKNSKKNFASHIHGCRNYNDSYDSRTGRVYLAGPLSAVGSGRGGGRPQKKILFSSACLQKVRLKLQLVCSHRKRLTRPIESWCLIDKQLSSLDESRFLRGGRRGAQKKDPFFVRLVAKSSFKIATSVFAPKKADTSHRIVVLDRQTAFVP